MSLWNSRMTIQLFSVGRRGNLVEIGRGGNFVGRPNLNVRDVSCISSSHPPLSSRNQMKKSVDILLPYYNYKSQKKWDRSNYICLCVCVYVCGVYSGCKRGQGQFLFLILGEMMKCNTEKFRMFTIFLTSKSCLPKVSSLASARLVFWYAEGNMSIAFSYTVYFKLNTPPQ